MNDVALPFNAPFENYCTKKYQFLLKLIFQAVDKEKFVNSLLFCFVKWYNEYASDNPFSTNALSILAFFIEK